MVGDVIRDIKYAIRSFVRRPLFTAVIVLTLALGIGSNVAMFSVANAVLLRALPYDHPEELALVWTRLQATNVERSLVSGPDLGDYQAQTTRFEGFAGHPGHVDRQRSGRAHHERLHDLEHVRAARRPATPRSDL
jgi:hypothetical protein